MLGNYKNKQGLWLNSIQHKARLKRGVFKSKDLRNFQMITKNKKDYCQKIRKEITLYHQDSDKINKNN